MNLNTILTAVAPYVGSVVRKAVVAGGAVLASKGVETTDGDVQLVSGALLALGGAVWSIYNKWRAAKQKGVAK